MLKKIVFSERLKFLALVIVILTALGLINFIRFTTNELAEGNPARLQFYLIMESTGAYALLLLIPVLVWFFNRFPLQKKNLLRRLLLYLLAFLIYGASHTILMYLSRILIYRFIQWGAYDYGDLRYRFAMEYSHQIIEFWIIFGAVYLAKKIHENQKHRIRTMELEQQLTRVRLQTLQMQLQPHFLFNTLNMISATMYEDVKAADRMIANLSDLLRVSLSSSSAAEHTLKKELQILELYCEIMKARFHDRLVISSDVPDEIRTALLPGLILQPLIENSLKHALKGIKTARIDISAARVSGRLRLVIADNGPGFSGDIQTLLKQGIGLSITLERLEKLYGPDQLLELQNRPEGGARVVIEIPFRLA